MSIATTESRPKKQRPKPNDTAISSKGGSTIYCGGGDWMVIAPGLRTGIYKLGAFVEDAQARFNELERQPI